MHCYNRSKFETITVTLNHTQRRSSCSRSGSVKLFCPQASRRMWSHVVRATLGSQSIVITTSNACLGVSWRGPRMHVINLFQTLLRKGTAGASGGPWANWTLGLGKGLLPGTAGVSSSSRMYGVLVSLPDHFGFWLSVSSRYRKRCTA